MATLITKNSQTASAVPSAASLLVGELAVNTADGKLYTEHTGGVVKEIIPSTVVNGGITPAKLSTGAPVWNTGGTLVVNGSTSLGYSEAIAVRGSIATTGSQFNIALASAGDYEIINRSSGSSGFQFYTNGASQVPVRIAGNSLLFDSGYGSAAIAYGCRAWVNFNGIGTVSIRASGNVSSITDNGTGDFTVNFTTAMPDANFSASPCGSDGGFSSILMTQTLNATSSVRLFQRQISGAAIDLSFMQVAIFR